MTSEKNKEYYNTPFVDSITRKAKMGHIRDLLGTHVRVYHQMANVLKMYDGTVADLDHDYRWNKYEKKEILICRVTFTTTHGGEQNMLVELYREQPRGSRTATTGIRLSPSTQGLSISQRAVSKISFQIDSKIMLAEDGVLKI
jgi:hypothetical protein